CRSRSTRRPSRITLWSSARRMRILPMSVVLTEHRDREFGAKRGAAAALGIEHETAADMAHALLHAQQPEAAGGSRIESRSIVLNADADALRFLAQRDLHVPRLSMARRVVQRFLHEAEYAGLVFFRQVIGGFGSVH